MISNETEAYMLDAVVLFRFLYEPGPMRREVYAVLQNRDSPLFVSHVTLWETLSKVFRHANYLENTVVQQEFTKLRKMGVGFVPFIEQDLAAAIALPNIHRDPFDRMLIEQAQRLGATIISSDRMLPRYDVKVLPL